MHRAPWIPFFPPAILLALAAFACGGSAIVNEGADGGGSAPGPTPARCLFGAGLDSGVVYTATVGPYNESDAGLNAALIEWTDDAGGNVRCGPPPWGCDAQCSAGRSCDVAFLTHSLVQTGGTCL